MSLTIYSTSSCGYCKMLKSYLNQKGVKYSEKHADIDQAAAQELYEKSGQLGVPFTIIKKDDGSEVTILGFDKPKVDSALNIKD